jgi:hypothetical protein
MVALYQQNGCNKKIVAIILKPKKGERRGDLK